MFKVFFILYLVFAGVHILFSAAIMYHLKRFVLPGHSPPRIVLGAYTMLSAIFLASALYFLIKLPI